MSRGQPYIVPPKLSDRLSIASYIALASALLLAVVALSTIEYINLRRTLLQDTQVEAKILADNVAAALLFNDTRAAHESVATMRASPTIERISILRNDGSVFVPVAAVDPAIAALAQPRVQHRYAFDHLDLIHPIEHEKNLIGYVHLRKTLTRMYQQIALYSASALGVAGVALLLAWLVVARVQRTVTIAEKTLHSLAHIDATTALWNRNTFNLHLRGAISAAQKSQQEVALLLLDLDNFKAINDAIGHPGGDALLAAVAERLNHFLGDDDIACRLGGDEFAIVLQRADVHAYAASTADNIAHLFSTPFVLEGQELFATCSLGISIYPQNSADNKALIRNADTAMYHAKVDGKNGHRFFTNEMHLQLQRRGTLEAGLRRAIIGNELALHFQPQYDLRTKTLVGAEALLRWHSRELGVISPAEFIPIAEDSGCIVEIGEWVLRTACRTLREWQQQGFNLPLLGINLSSRQLRVPNLTQRILEIIEQEQIEPSFIELELTESLLMENMYHFIEDFKPLQRHGVKLSIDDFGTGYSSMAYLKRLPLDRIKIDRSFVQDLPHGANDREIVAAMIAMSHNLGLRVIAEGVENAAQAEFLARAGCDTVQGYHFGRPMPASDFIELLQQKKSASV
jgi:diguanylate cyclase (GGDEF)-like protein